MCTLHLPKINILFLRLEMEVRLAVQRAEHSGERFPVGFYYNLRSMGICVHGRGVKL
jgi:hypothetical protein